jgi:transposase
MNQINEDLCKTAYLGKRCPECGNIVKAIDKDTSSGREIRLCVCTVCKWSAYIDVGIAFWKALEPPEPSDWGSD